MSAAMMVALVAAGVAVLGWALRALVAAAREEARIRADWRAHMAQVAANRLADEAEWKRATATADEIMHPRHRGES